MEAEEPTIFEAIADIIAAIAKTPTKSSERRKLQKELRGLRKSVEVVYTQETPIDSINRLHKEFVWFELEHNTSLEGGCLYPANVPGELLVRKYEHRFGQAPLQYAFLDRGQSVYALLQ